MSKYSFHPRCKKWIYLYYIVLNQEKQIYTYIQKSHPRDGLTQLFERDGTDEFGETLLHHSCRQGKYKLTHHLIQQGWSPYVKNKYNQTPFDILVCQYVKSEEFNDIIYNNLNICVYSVSWKQRQKTFAVLLENGYRPRKMDKLPQKLKEFFTYYEIKLTLGAFIRIEHLRLILEYVNP